MEMEMFKGWALESSFFGKRCALGYSYFGKGWVGKTLKLQQGRGFELDMQESGATAASDREGGVCREKLCKLVQVWLFLHPF